MAFEVSSPESDVHSHSQSHTQNLSNQLDADIARVRAEIQSLTKRKQLLTSSLLSTTKVQTHLTTQKQNQQPDIPTHLPLLQLHSQAEHNRTNIHRLAYGITSFPFTDPNPDTSDKPLLGIRFDIPSRNGKFEKAPYYIFLKRVNQDDVQTNTNTNTNPSRRRTSTNNFLKIHHHTIPALVPLQDYEAKYLPPHSTTTVSHETQNERRRDEGYFSPSPLPNNNDDTDMHDADDNNDDNSDDDNDTISPGYTHPSQDVHGLTTAVRNDLVSWQLRTDSISLLAEELKVSNPNTKEDGSNAKFSLESIQATAVDALFCRIVWKNGTVGRLRLTEDGHIDRAIVIGEVGGDGKPERMKDIERFLSTGEDGGRLSVMMLKERLKQAETRIYTPKEEGLQHVDEGNDGMEVGHADT